MRKLSLTAVFLAAAISPLSWAQNATPCPTATSLPKLIQAVDDAVSGPANKDRTCMRQIFVPGAHLIPLVKGKDGQWAPHVLTVEDWITRVAERGSEPFYEHQIKYSIDRYGHMAHMWSTYEIRETPHGKVMARGINSMQAYYNGHAWKLVEIVWEEEIPSSPLPKKYLP
jgi:hypothetical protein